MELSMSVLIFWTLFILTQGSSLTPTEHQLLDKIEKYYKKEAFPNDNRNHIHGSELLTVQFFMSFKNMRIQGSDLLVEAHLWLSWFDERLNLPPSKVRSRLKLPERFEIWQPQLNFDPGFEQVSSTLIVLNNASIEADIVKTGRVPCTYDPSHYPFETRICPLTLNTEYGIDMECHADGTCVREPLQSDVSSNINGIRASWTSSYFETVDEGPRVEVKLRIRREVGSFYVVTVFLPSFALLALIWLAGFVRRRTVRAILSASSLIALLLMWTFNTNPGSRETKTEYNLVDIWLLGCFLLDLVAIFEFILVNGALYRQETCTSSPTKAYSIHSSRVISRHSSDLEESEPLNSRNQINENAGSLVLSESHINGGSHSIIRTNSKGSHLLPKHLIATEPRRKKRFFSLHCMFMVAYPIFVLLVTVCYVIAVAALSRSS